MDLNNYLRCLRGESELLTMKKIQLIIIYLLCCIYACDVEMMGDVESEFASADTCNLVIKHVDVLCSTIKIDSDNYIIPKYNVFTKERGFKPVFRSPIIMCTKKETILAACTNQELLADYGEMDILLARKRKESDEWEVKKIFDSDSVKGRSMCPALVVDNSSGRIYIIASYFKNNKLFGIEHFHNDVDHVYKYSDDDGATWSKEYSLKQYWKNSFTYSLDHFRLFGGDNYNQSDNCGFEGFGYLNNFINDNVIYYSSGPKGLTIDDVLLIPSCVVINGDLHSTLLIRKNDSWHFSRPSPNPGDNECTVYIDNGNHIVLDCRTEKTTRRKYYYDIFDDEFTEVLPSDIGSYVQVSTEIIKDNGLFYMCFPDSYDNIRENITFYGSKDGIKWDRVFLINEGNITPYGYTSISLCNNKLFVSYETPEGIFVLDMTSCRDKIRDLIMKSCK